MNGKSIALAQYTGCKDIVRIAALPLTTTRASSLPGVGLLAGSHRWAMIRMGFRSIPLLLMAAFVAYVVFSFGLLVLLTLLVLANQGIGTAHQVKARPKPTSRRGLQRLMVQEEMVKVKDGQKPPKLTIISKVEDEFGKTLRVRAIGTTVDDWKKRKNILAIRANVPLSLVEIIEDPDRPPHEFDIWIGKPGGRKTRVATLPETTDFYEEFEMGRTLVGRIVQAQMFEVNTMVCGIQGRGKSVFVRRFILHALLDPEGEAFVVDGKGSLVDYQAAIPALSAYISVSQPDSKEALEALFDYLISEVDRLNAAGQRKARLLVLEEWQRIGKTGDKEYDKRIQAKLRIIYKLGRSTGLHVLLVTQRPSAVAIDTEIRDLFAQVITFAQKTSASYRMALGETPEVSLPRKKGEAILSNDEETVFVLVDWLKDEVWLKACDSLAHREPLALGGEPDPLAQAIRESAHRLTADSVSPTDLWVSLDESVRPGSVAHLGRGLSQMGISKVGAVYRRSDLLEATGSNNSSKKGL